MRRMNLEPVIEWSKSEREKQILYINAYIWNLEGWYWWTYLQGSSGDAYTENRFTDTVGKETVGRIVRVALKHTLPRVKWIARGSLRCDSGSSNLAPCDSLEGWDWVGGGREVQERGCVYTYGWFMLMHGRTQHHCKAVILQLKNKLFFSYFDI